MRWGGWFSQRKAGFSQWRQHIHTLWYVRTVNLRTCTSAHVESVIARLNSSPPLCCIPPATRAWYRLGPDTMRRDQNAMQHPCAYFQYPTNEKNISDLSAALPLYQVISDSAGGKSFVTLCCASPVLFTSLRSQTTYKFKQRLKLHTGNPDERFRRALDWFAFSRASLRHRHISQKFQEGIHDTNVLGDSTIQKCQNSFRSQIIECSVEPKTPSAETSLQPQQHRTLNQRFGQFRVRCWA